MRPPRPIALLLIAATAAACGQTAPPPPSKIPLATNLASASAPRAPRIETSVLPGQGTFVARSATPLLDIWRAPGPGASVSLRMRSGNGLGQHVAFLVLGGFRDRDEQTWLHIALPIRPNGSSGWVRSQDVALSRARDRIVVDLSERTLRRYEDGRLRQRIEVAIGASSSPTATGRFFVWGRVSYADPSGPYGAFALGLSGFSPVLSDWPGGGRMAIHGTTDPTDLGRRVSHGCIRVLNADLTQLRDVPLGTPVFIRP